MLLQSIYSIVQSFPGFLRAPWLFRVLLLLPLLPALGLFLSSCGKREAALKPAAEPVIARGDSIVVEATAAHFFEGKVLSTEGGRLRVQTTDGADSVSVAVNDAYRLPPSKHDAHAGGFAICNTANAWLPCRITRATPEGFSATDTSGNAFELTPDHVLVPLPLTELNLKRYFARSEAELEFKRNAASAGNPKPEPGWHPQKRERVLAKVGQEWFTAYVQELEQDGVSVSLAGTQATSTLPASSLAAEPPSSFAAELHRGDFVLVRPESPSQPWSARLVRSTNGTELKLADALGAIKTTSPRDVVPLGQ